MKDKMRYILVKTTYNIDEDPEFFKNLNRELMREIGELNYADVNPKLMLVLNDNLFIMKVSLAGFSMLVSALSFIKKINNKQAAFYTIKSSGTIKALIKNMKQKEKVSDKE
ncbi:MAG: Rpp14/Pop5 family protein [Candidatus Micrarchaeia archaeon]